MGPRQRHRRGVSDPRPPCPAAEEAYPTCIELAGHPAGIRPETGDGLVLGRNASCPAQELRNDDGSFNNVYGISGIEQGVFVKRFTPACQPFQLEQIDFIVGASSSIEGDSWRAVSLSPDALVLTTGGTWMIRGHGDALPSGSVELTWGEPCNLGAVPDQDFAVYTGTIGSFTQRRRP